MYNMSGVFVITLRVCVTDPLIFSKNKSLNKMNFAYYFILNRITNVSKVFQVLVPNFYGNRVFSVQLSDCFDERAYIYTVWQGNSQQ